MTEVESNMASVSASEFQSQSVDKDALIVRLDELLETYLHTIDKYQKTREQLSKQLSSVRSSLLLLYGILNVL
jgi:2-phosphoglycerate kinase